MINTLESLRAAGSTIVCDSGDFATMIKYKATDATTNPSLILAAARKPEYSELIDNSIAMGHFKGTTLESKVNIALNQILIEFGIHILRIIPGRVSTEVDARLSFSKERTVAKALHIIDLYKQNGISKSRVLIKIAATWEGIQAARILQTQYGIDCNMTLIFSMTQAIASAEARSFLISPFVGRILDWHKASTGKDYKKEEDPGVQSVKDIFYHYKRHDYKTIVMGASFRNVDEITELAGCDYLTIAPTLLDTLITSSEPVQPKLVANQVSGIDVPQRSYINDEPKFRFEFNENTMAVEKLREGISKFSADTEALRLLLLERFVR